MTKKHSLKIFIFLTLGGVMLLFALILRPCSNGATVTILNSRATSVLVELSGDYKDIPFFEKVVPAFSGPATYRLYFQYGKAYRIRVYDPSKKRLIMQGGNFGYISPPLVHHAYFFIGDHIDYADWQEKSAIMDILKTSSNMLSCTDSYILGRIQSLY